MDDSSTEIPKLTDNVNSELGGKIMLFSVVTLMAVVLFILCFHFYARLLYRHVHRRSAESHSRSAYLPAICHRGLLPSLVKLIPTFHYSAAGAHPRGLECAVCLSEFEDGETGRVLPDCRHCFHVDCIDTWFRSHSSCPLCRAPVRPTAREAGSGEVFVPIGHGVVVGSDPGSEGCGCSATAAVLMVPVECRMKPPVWIVPITAPNPV